jgi:hypothetical protein
VARGGNRLIVRILLWIVFVAALAVVSFFVGYLIGPMLIDRLV